MCEMKFSRKGNLQVHKKVHCKCKHCHKQFSSPWEIQNHICQEKNTTKPAAERLKPDEAALQTPLVPLPSNQVQNLERPIPEAISKVPIVISSNSRPRKSLKIKRPNKKSAEQNNEPIQNPDTTNHVPKKFNIN